MKLIQVLLSNGSSRMTTWIEDHPKLKKGCTLTLKEFPKVTWILLELYQKNEKALNKKR